MNKIKIIPLSFILFTLCYFSLAAQDAEYQRIEIPRSDYILQGYFFKSTISTSAPTVLFMQGLPGGEGDELNLGKYFSVNGINLLSFNYSGIFSSGGKQSLSNALDDIQSALDFLKRKENAIKYNIDTSKIILGGYSFGGGMALTFLEHHNYIYRVFSIAGNDHGKFAEEVLTDTAYLNMMVDYFNKYLKEPNGPVKFVYENPIEELLENSDKYYNKLLAKNLSENDVLLIGALDDGNVTIENHLLPLYRELKKNNNQKVSFIIYQTNHSFQNVITEMNEDIVNWIKR